jgi:hypothetical protein
MNNKLCFCFCFVQNEEDLKADLVRPKDFTKTKLALSQLLLNRFWRLYKKQIVKPFRRLRQKYEKQPDIYFRSNVTANEFRSILLSGRYETVILFSHCKNGGEPDECIEFFDMLISSQELATWVPATLSMHLDFSVCKPKILRKELESIRGRQFVIVNWEWDINLQDWLQLYQLILAEVISHPKNGYARSFTNALQQFF